MISFPRTDLARQMVPALMGRTLFGDAHNGLFLSGPRRTGKSTFLQADLKPALEAEGVVVVYTDLWEDTGRDPATVIADAIGKALEPQLGLVARTAKKAGLDKLSLAGWLQVDTSRIGRVDGLTLVDALRALNETAGKPVALIIDEAQQALTSERGEVAMTSLKSARDQLNRRDEVNLMLVMSGSDRDKLMRLVNSNAAPFFGSQVQRMPPLGADFIAHVAGLIEAQRPSLAPVDQAALQQAFEAIGHRPQLFMSTLDGVLSPFSGIRGRFEKALLEASSEHSRRDEEEMESTFLGLKPIEQVVLWRMLEMGGRFRAFDAEALRFYGELLAQPVSVGMAQRALESLRERSPVLVWKSARGEYAVQDAAMHRWFDERRRNGTWPPVPRQVQGLGDD